MDTKKEYFSIPQAAKFCSIGRVTFWRWVKSGHVKVSVTPGGRHRILKEDLESFMIENGMMDASEKKSSKQKVLIVDDDPNVLDVFKDCLSSHNYKADVAQNGFEAGVKLMEFKPDLLILDLVMPELDGFEVCRIIKSDPTTKHIKIIVLTGYDTKENEAQVKEFGADLFLTKPVEEDILLGHIKNILKKG
ncbi:response regulator receiver domain-containing protein [Candidatus Magnetomorum sp. HK-1]|nr:response regulator receiver domain-containing protein [Candidatus Magnetomorum sp. HK-1]